MKKLDSDLNNLAPQVGLEPTTLRLTAECSAIELLRSVLCAKLSNTKVAESAQCVKMAHSFRLAKTTGVPICSPGAALGNKPASAQPRAASQRAATGDYHRKRNEQESRCPEFPGWTAAK